MRSAGYKDGKDVPKSENSTDWEKQARTCCGWVAANDLMRMSMSCFRGKRCSVKETGTSSLSSSTNINAYIYSLAWHPGFLTSLNFSFKPLFSQVLLSPSVSYCFTSSQFLPSHFSCLELSSSSNFNLFNSPDKLALINWSTALHGYLSFWNASILSHQISI